MRFTEKQTYAWKHILTNPHKQKILFDGGARSGKTVVLIEYIFARAFQFPGAKQLIARKFRSSAENSVWNETIRDYAARCPASGTLFHLVDSKLKVFVTMTAIPAGIEHVPTPAAGKVIDTLTAMHSAK